MSFEVVATMRSLVKAQEEQHQLNAAILQSLTDLQKKIDSGREGSKSSTRRRRRNSSGPSDSEESSGDTSSSSHKRKRRRHHKDRSRDEFRKVKPPTFDGEIKTGQEAESLASCDKEVLSSAGLFKKHEGKIFHIQFEWKGIHLVGTLQASKEDQ